MVDDSQKISSNSASSPIYFLTKGSFLGIVTCNIFKVAKTSSYISAILGIILSLIPFAVIMYIQKNNTEDSIVIMINKMFGKVIGNVINGIISIFLLGFASILLYNFITFINIEFMPETSRIYIAILIIALFSFMLSQSKKSMCNASLIMMYISLITMLFIFVGISSNVEFSNLFPIFEGKVSGILKGAVIYAVFTSFPTFLITLIGKNIVKDENKYIKDITKFYILSSVILVLLFVIALASLGINIISLKKYPEYVVFTQIKLLNILERVQNIFSIQLYFNVIVLCMLCMWYFKEFINLNMKNQKIKQYVPFAVPTLVVLLSLNLFPNMTVANNFYMYKLPYIFGIGMSSIILIIFIRMLSKKKKFKT